MRTSEKLAAELRKVAAVARRMATILHRMWIDGTNFRWTNDEPQLEAA